ncbi:AsmA-like C-terminal region-containing protein [Aureimonas sp. SK2]|uniref:AsmA family protein n=1 Tax=Aureimonas sp. SK2 TaxID=3015992 RepID=UPI002444B14C|nr:AsmA-like C-terminal region-containing protein [Aureimonas sp. SK2]
MKLFIALGGLLVLALLTLLVGPSFVDWTSYRASFEAEASRILGQRVEVRGTASARLLPFPSLSFTDVVVGDDPTDPVLTVRAFRMDAELAPYLSGEIRIFDMRLDGPALSVPVEGDGTIRWPVGSRAAPPSETVVLERIVVADGSAVLADRRSSRRIALTAIDATLSAQSLRGPFAGSATLLADGRPLAASFSTGSGAGDGRLPLRLTLDSQALDLRATLDAVISSLPGEPLADGTLALLSPIDPTAERPDGAPAPLLPPLRLTTELGLTPTSLRATELRAEVGAAEVPYVATGSALVDVGSIPRFDLQLDGQAIDVDRIAPPSAPAGEPPGLPARIEALRAALERLPTPGMPGRVRLSLPLVTVGDTTIRSVSLAGSPATEGWSLQSFSAELPGRTLVEASGVLRTEGEAGFRGNLLLAARQPAAFLGWAAGAADPALTRLGRAGFSADVDLSAADQRFDGLEIDLDGRSLTGAIRRAARPEGNNTTIDLRGADVDLEPVGALARLLALQGGAPREGERFELQFSAGPARWGDVEAASLDADLTFDRGLADIASLDATAFAGTDLHVEGTLADPFGTPRPDLSLEIASADPARLAEFLRARLPASPLVEALARRAPSLAPLSLTGTAASQGTNRDDLAVELWGTAAGTELNLRVALENGLAAAERNGRFGLDLHLNQADADVLLAQAGLAVLPLGETMPLSATLALSGEPGAASDVSIQLAAPGTDLSANGSATIGSEGLRAAVLALRLRSDDLASWATRLALAFGQPLDDLPASGEATVSLADGSWSVDGLAATLGTARLSGALTAPAGGPVSGRLAMSNLSLDWLGRLATGVDLAAAVAGEGGQPPAFAAPLLPGRAFRLALGAKRAQGLGLSLSGLSATVEGDGTRLAASDLSAELAGGGRLSGGGEVRNAAGILSTRLDMALAGRPLDAGAGLLAGRLDLSGMLTGGGESWPALLASLDGRGRLTLADGTLRGVRPDLLAPVVEASEAEGFEPGLPAVAALVDRLSAGASASLGDLTADWTLGAGVLRTAPLRRDFAGAVLEGTGALDLRAGRVEAELALQMTPPADETVEGTAPSVAYRIQGPLDAPVLQASVEPLAAYLSELAARREEERIEAIEDDLRETVRLRREARLYRERERLREDLRQERLAREAAEREEAARREAEERRRMEAARAAEAAESARRAAAQESAAREAAARAAAQAEAEAAARAATPRPSPPADFELQPLPPPPASPGTGFGGLPGVSNPNQL